MLEIILNIITKQQLENDIWVNLDWCIAITAVAYIFAMRIYKKI